MPNSEFKMFRSSATLAFLLSEIMCSGEDTVHRRPSQCGFSPEMSDLCVSCAVLPASLSVFISPI